MTYNFPDRLGAMMAAQRSFQERVTGVGVLYEGLNAAPVENYAPSRIEEFRLMVMALQDELHEALGEMGWKPWADSRHFNTEAVQGELVDAWCFLMSLMLLAGLTPETLYRKYMVKMEINRKRQDNGYDGIAGKCPSCRRAYDDPAVRCTGPDADGNEWCERDY